MKGFRHRTALMIAAFTAGDAATMKSPAGIAAAGQVEKTPLGGNHGAQHVYRTVAAEPQ
jgi:hypothetical protein